MNRNNKRTRFPFKKRFLESEKTSQDLLEHLPVGVYRTAPDAKIIEANQAMVGIPVILKTNFRDSYVKGRI